MVDGKAPPPSVYPHIQNKTLVDWHQQATGFPNIPGVKYPQRIHQPAAQDNGPQFYTHGLLTEVPPKILGHYVVRVPKCDVDGNDLGTLLPPEVMVPLATYTGWNVRRPDFGAAGALVSLTGSYLPFPRTRVERQKTGDPRQSLEERDSDFAMYQKRFAAACADLVRGRYLLPEDEQRLTANRAKLRPLFTNPAP